MFCELETAFEEPILEERAELSAKEQTALKHAHIKERGEWQLKRQVRMLEVATRQVIPGDDMKAKMQWVAERNNGELQALCAYIADVCTGLREGQMHEIMKQIHSMSSHETKIVSNFSEWEIAAQTLANFRMCRPVEDFVFQIPMKGISQTRKLEIDQECILPVPPMKMGIDPQTQRPSPKYKKENPRDPDYIRAKRAVEDKWMIMILDECMPFKIPGTSIKEKREWLNRRLLGDVIKLRQFIDNELLGSLSRYNFFTKGSALLS
jgi:hypothetical protein